MHRKAGTRGLIFALVCYTALFLLQLIAYFSTNVLVLFAQAFETLSDVLISSILLLVTFWSLKPPDEDHAFGHERAQFIAAVISAAVLIAFFSSEAIRRGIEELTHHPAHMHNTGLAIGVTIAGMAIVAVPLFVLRGEESRRAATARAQMFSLARDEFAYGIALVAIVLSAKGYGWADGVGSIIVGVMIALAAVFLFLESYDFLIGKSPGKDTLARLTAAAMSVPEVMEVHELMVEHVGPRKLHVDMHITVEPGTSLEEADRIAKEVELKLAPLTENDQAGIHVEPHPGHRLDG
jgi:ferrous-iron efflux pump FieF